MPLNKATREFSSVPHVVIQRINESVIKRCEEIRVAGIEVHQAEVTKLKK